MRSVSLSFLCFNRNIFLSFISFFIFLFRSLFRFVPTTLGNWLFIFGSAFYLVLLFISLVILSLYDNLIILCFNWNIFLSFISFFIFLFSCLFRFFPTTL